MTSGIPLSPEEQQYIRDHVAEGPARIAFDLGRKRNAVKAFIRRDRAGAPLVLEIPPEISRAAREKGITPDQIRFVALREILKIITQKGVKHGTVQTEAPET